MAEKTQANIGFEKQLWDAACVLWYVPKQRLKCLENKQQEEL